MVERMQGDPGARDRDALLLAHMRIVFKVARSFRGYALSDDELISAGLEGLTRCVSRFRSDRGARFATHCEIWIRAAISEAVRKNSLVRTPESRSGKALFWRLRTAQRRLGIVDTMTDEQVSELARLFGCSADDVRLADAHQRSHLSLNTSLQIGGEEASAEMIDLLADNDALSPEAELIVGDEAAHRHRLLEQALVHAGLTAREIDILRGRRLSEPVESLATLGRRWHLSRERIRQIEGDAFKKVAVHLRAMRSESGAEAA